MRNVLRPLFRWIYTHCLAGVIGMFRADINEQLWRWFN
jgi:hypothetical protein